MDAQKTLRHVAELARLGPYDPQREHALSQQFQEILTLFKDLATVPKPEASCGKAALTPQTPLRQDDVQVFPQKEKIVNGFPRREGNLLKVPKVIE
ncbi:MAG: Asp-tRNA(Asn)/Glu-tRNA(Gln) amidotransferase subunit GatC [Elusimicrobiota bacterium]